MKRHGRLITRNLDETGQGVMAPIRFGIVQGDNGSPAGIAIGITGGSLVHVVQDRDHLEQLIANMRELAAKAWPQS